MAKVLNFGSLNLDYVYGVDHFVQPGETLGASSQAVKAGGKGLNQSIALARAGAKVYHAGCLGTGGAMLGELLRENGVDTAHLVEVEELQGNAVIQVTPAGENSIILFGGSNQCVTRSQIDRTLAMFGEGDWLVLQNEINDLPYLVDCAHERGMRVALNPSPYNEALDAVDFGKLEWLFVNEIEARQISGSDDPEAAWATLHEKYPQLSVLITLGGEGSVAYQVAGEEVSHASQGAFAAKAVDTTGAGDTYTGFFVASLIAGLPLEECMRRASRAAAIGVTRAGAAASIPMLWEIVDGTVDGEKR